MNSSSSKRQSSTPQQINFAKSLRSYSPSPVQPASRPSISNLSTKIHPNQLTFSNLSTDLYEQDSLFKLLKSIVNELVRDPKPALPKVHKVLNDSQFQLKTHIQLHIFTPEEKTKYGKFLITSSEFWIILQIYFHTLHP